MKKYLNYKLYDAFTSPLFYVCALILNLCCSADYFFVHKFFGGSGSTDLHNFFKIIPFMTGLLLPVLKLNESKSSLDQCVPLRPLKKITIQWLSLFIQYVFILLPLIFLPVCVNLFGSVDWNHVFTGFIAVFFYGALCAALCQFLFELITIPAASCLVSVCVLLATVAADSLFSWNSNPVINGIISCISFSRHFSAAEKGILDTRDLCYFAILTADFLVAATFAKEKSKGFNLSGKSWRFALLFILLSIFTALDSSRIYARIDCTSTHKYRVSPYSKALVKASEDKIRITYLQSKNLAANFTEVQGISDYLKEFAAKTGASLKILNAEKLENRKLLEKYNIFARQIPVSGNNRTEYLNVYSTIIIEYKDKTEVIPFILAQNSLEYDLDTRILSLITGKRRIVNILCGNGMDLHQDYSYVEPWLNSQGFICNEIYLSGNFEKQLSYSNLLVVFGSGSLSMDHCQSIIDFIEKGGAVFFAVSPYDADIENDWNLTKSQNQNLLEILQNYGFHFTGSIVQDLSCARILLQSDHNSDGTPAESTYSQQLNYPMWVSLLPQKNSLSGLTMYWPAELTETEETETILSSSPMAWTVEPDRFSPQKPFETNPMALEKAEFPAAGNIYPLSLSSKNRKIHIVPDQYFVNSLMLGYTGGTYGDYRNLDYLSKTLLVLNGEEELSKIFEKSLLTGNTGLFKTYNTELFISARNRTLFCQFIFVPAIILAGFLLQIKARKRRILRNE